MIKLQYDINTAGVRVSFVITDSEKCSSSCVAFQGKANVVTGECVIPQTRENLDIIQVMLDKAKRDLV